MKKDHPAVIPLHITGPNNIIITPCFLFLCIYLRFFNLKCLSLTRLFLFFCVGGTMFCSLSEYQQFVYFYGNARSELKLFGSS